MEFVHVYYFDALCVIEVVRWCATVDDALKWSFFECWAGASRVFYHWDMCLLDEHELEDCTIISHFYHHRLTSGHGHYGVGDGG